MKKNIISTLLKFAGYIHNHKILPGNIFGLIFEKQDGRHRRFFDFQQGLCWPSRAKGIIGRDLKFAGYVQHYKILTGYIFGLIVKNKMAASGISLSVMKSAYICLIKRPARDACLCMGELQAPLAPHFVFLITL